MKEFRFGFDFNFTSKLFQTFGIVRQGADSRKRFLQNGTLNVLLPKARVSLPILDNGSKSDKMFVGKVPYQTPWPKIA